MKIFRSLCISLLAINSSLSFYSNNSKRFVSSLGAMALFSNYQGIRGDGNGGQGMILLPKDGIYENVIIFMHGLGDTCQGWGSLMPEFGLAKTKFILPDAPTRPISLNGGFPMSGWSDIMGLDMDANEDRNGFDESRSRIEKLIDAEIDKQIDAKKIIVGGFSQGGAVALHTGLRYKHTLGGIVALSTWLPLRNDYPAAFSEKGKGTPVFQVHGDEDVVVNYAWGKKTSELLSQHLTSSPAFLTIEGMGHSSDPDEIRELKSFLESKLL